MMDRIGALERPTSVAELDEALSRPDPDVIDTVGRLGDVVVLGAGGKVGPSLSRMLARARAEACGSGRIVAVSRWSDPTSRAMIEEAGVETVAVDLSDPRVWAALPDADAVYYLVGQKFGTASNPALTWWMNACVPAFAADRYRGVPTVVYSSGNVYPRRALHEGGATELTPVDPVGAYAQSCVAREQAFAHAARSWGTPVLLYRLNYALELRYGVLADIAHQLMAGKAVDVSMPMVNAVWQGDANRWAVRCIELATSPAAVLNVTGPETASVRALAEQLASLLGVGVTFTGAEGPDALLNDAGRCHQLYGYPKVSLAQALEWVAAWVAEGGESLGKPTKFTKRDGSY